MIVDPKRLLIVSIDGGVVIDPFSYDPHRSENILAIACHYVVVKDSSGKLAVAIEVAWDTSKQNPTGIYVLSNPDENLHREIFPPKKITKIKPFWSIDE